MSPFFDDLEAQLRAAAQARTAGAPPEPPPRRRRWGRLRSGLRAAPVALAVAVAALVLVGALVLVHRGAGTPPAPAPAARPSGPTFAQIIARTPAAVLRRELRYIGDASRGVISTGACRVAEPKAGFVNGTPDRRLLSLLGVLRRPATPADRVRAGALAGATELYAGYVRRALAARGVVYYLAPARYDPATVMPGPRCFALQVAALQNELHRIPVALRTPTQRLQRAFMAYDRGLVARAPRSVLCLVAVVGRGANVGCGQTAAQIEQGMFPEQDNGAYVEIVPDGVASVTLGIPAAAGRPARSATAAVHGNLVAIRAPDRNLAAPGTSLIWRSATGRVVKRITAPRDMSLRQACRARPGACAAMTAATLAFSSGGSSGASSSSSSASAPASAPQPAPSGG